MIKQDVHQFVGMQQDIKSPDVNSKYIYEGKNIKITSQGDNSLLHVTNIKGNEKIGDLLGVYLGHCIIGNYLVLFTTEVATESKTAETPDPGGSLTPKEVGVVSSGLNVHKEIDHIYRITISEDTESIELVELFVGNLGFSLDHPIETLGIYENEHIQKVYWVDGLNKPRVINIVKGQLVNNKYNNSSFDFIPSLKLDENVEVSKQLGSGTFLPGTIQYMCTYYNKYGQESNAFYTSELFYINPPDRGGEPNETVSNSFNINIENPNLDFEFIRVYSIHRTSLDAQPTVKIVGDYKIFDAPEIDKGASEKVEVLQYDLLKWGLEQPFTKKEKWDGTIRCELSESYLDVAKKLFIKQEGDEIPLLDFIKNANIVTETDNNVEYTYVKIDNCNLIYKKDSYTTCVYTRNNQSINTTFLLGVEPKYAITNNKRGISLRRGGLYISQPNNITGLGIVQIKKTTIKSNITEETIKGMSIIDTGNTGSIIDPTLLLYLGGEDILASTIASKDNTLFLGNVEIKRPSVNLLNLKLSESKCKAGLRNTNIKVSEKNSYYSYESSLDTGYNAGFKSGEKYRLGLQFQYKNGKWSDPIHLEDYEMPANIRPRVENECIQVPKITYQLNKDNGSYLIEEGYYKVRPVVVFPTLEERQVLLQGMVCPTMYNIGSRLNGTPYSQSSWFVRPIYNRSNLLNENLSSRYDIDEGSFLEFEHNKSIFLGDYRGSEVQGIKPLNNNNIQAGSGLSDLFIENILSEEELKDTNIVQKFDAQEEFADRYFIDQSIITLHSPDLEWNPGIQSLSNKKYKFRIVGLINFTSSIGDIDIQTSTPPINPQSTGFFHKTLGINNAGNFNSAKSLASGLFYRDWIVNIPKDKDSDSIYTYWKDQLEESHWLIYPWHKSGSLNNDTKRPTDKGTRSAVLQKKIISNLKFSKHNTWLNDSWEPEHGISNISIFNNDQIALSKINLENYSEINYYGNIDSLVFSKKLDLYNTIPKYGSGDTSNGISNSFYAPISKLIKYDDASDLNIEDVKDPVRIKYKSSPHIVFGFNFSYTSENKLIQHILPSYGTLNAISQNEVNVKPSWIGKTQLEETSVTTRANNYPIIKYKSTKVPDVNTVGQLNDLYWYQESKDKSIIYECIQSINEPQNTLFKWKDVTNDSDNPIGTIYEYKGSLYRLHAVSENENNEITQYNLVYYSSNFVPNTSGTSNNLVVLNSTDFMISQSEIPNTNEHIYPYLYLAELYQETDSNTIFGGTSEEALKNNIWIPAGKALLINADKETTIDFTYGDTWYQRYDCLKTYPFTQEDENQVVEIASFMCETRVNADGRYDKNRGQLSNLNMTPRNFNLWNPVYSQKDNFFKYRILDSDFYKLNKFPNTITWTKEKHNGEDIDTWTNITMASTLDLDGDKGKIVSLNTFNNEIYCFQESGISNIIFNAREQISTTSGVPIEISNGMKVNGKRYLSNSIGCNNKWSIVESIYGIYFVDNITKGIYLLSDGVKSLSHTLNMKDYINKFTNIEPWKVNNFKPIAFNFNNDNIFNNFKVSYDKVDKKVYFVNGQDCLVYSEELGQFESFVDYQNTYSIINIQSNTYSLYYSPTGNSGNWYTGLWKNNVLDTTEIYGEDKDISLTVVSNQDPLNDKIFNTIEFRGNTYDDKGKFDPKVCPFNKIRVWNEYQDTEDVELVFNSNTPSNLKQKFRIWRANIPRDKSNGRDRIRNTWAKIKLTGNSKKIELNDLNIHYFM